MEYARGIGRGFHNFLSYERRWLDAEGCGDCQGQAVRALAEVLGSRLPDGYRALARELIDAVLPTLADLRSLRAQAYVILAWGHLWMSEVKDIEPLEAVAWSAARATGGVLRPRRAAGLAVVRVADDLCQRGVAARPVHCRQRWPNEDFLDVAQASFAFLDRQTTVEGVFWPVGNEGWYPRGEEKALYDQQPVEAVTMAEAALAAWELLVREQYLATFAGLTAGFTATTACSSRSSMSGRGACYDGLQASRRESQPGSGIDARLPVGGNVVTLEVSAARHGGGLASRRRGMPVHLAGIRWRTS